jgi:hypothetical protein
MLPCEWKSFQHVCHHEAGHAIAAHLDGAKITLIEVDPTCQKDGHIQVIRTTNQQKLIGACGGHAAERILWKRKMLLMSGSVPEEGLFARTSMIHADLDKRVFFGADLAGADGCWPPEKDNEFMLFSWNNLHHQLLANFDLVERVAQALFANHTLDHDGFMATIS